MHAALAVLCACALAAAQNNNQGDIDSIIQSVFGPPPAQGSQAKPGQQPSSSTQEPSTNLNPTNNVANNAGDKSFACTNSDGQQGECVPYYLCRNNSINTDGEDIIDIRVKDGPCESYMEMCCLPPDRAQTPITTVPPPTQEIRAGCGWRNPRGVGFRIKGDNDNEAKFGEFPWMVAILKEEPVDEADTSGAKLNVYVCGGSLINPRAVLTAAHCVFRAAAGGGGGGLRVRAGEWDTQTKNEIYPYQDRDVTDIVVHKDFNKGTLFYDIALLFLASPVTITQNVACACLPPAPLQGVAPARATGGTRCQAAGWGKDSFGKEGKYQVILKRVEVPVVAREQCVSKLRSTRLGRRFELHTSFMCAGGEPGRDTCKGDGGSPLVCPIQYEADRYEQYGIVAWGIGCGENGVPGVYADVGRMRTWVDDNVIAKGLDISTYSY